MLNSRLWEMAAASDVEDFITCGVCFFEYDHDDRKPKFLQCSHTVCLSCLKVNCSLVLLSKLSYTSVPCSIYSGNTPWRHDYVPFLSRYFCQVRCRESAKQRVCLLPTKIKGEKCAAETIRDCDYSFVSIKSSLNQTIRFTKKILKPHI